VVNVSDGVGELQHLLGPDARSEPACGTKRGAESFESRPKLVGTGTSAAKLAPHTSLSNTATRQPFRTRRYAQVPQEKGGGGEGKAARERGRKRGGGKTARHVSTRGPPSNGHYRDSPDDENMLLRKPF